MERWPERLEQRLCGEQAPIALIVDAECDVLTRCCAARWVGTQRIEVRTIASREAIDAIAKAVCKVIPATEGQGNE